MHKRNGTAMRRQNCRGRRAATTNTTAPRASHTPWCSAVDQGDPLAAIDSTDEAESTTMSPKTQKAATSAVSAAASRRAAAVVVSRRTTGRFGSVVAFSSGPPRSGVVPPTRRRRARSGPSRRYAGRVTGRRSTTPVATVNPPPAG